MVVFTQSVFDIVLRFLFFSLPGVVVFLCEVSSAGILWGGDPVLSEV